VKNGGNENALSSELVVKKKPLPEKTGARKRRGFEKKIFERKKDNNGKGRMASNMASGR